jgi:hypothetical protein
MGDQIGDRNSSSSKDPDRTENQLSGCDVSPNENFGRDPLPAPSIKGRISPALHELHGNSRPPELDGGPVIPRRTPFSSSFPDPDRQTPLYPHLSNTTVPYHGAEYLMPQATLNDRPNEEKDVVYRGPATNTGAWHRVLTQQDGPFRKYWLPSLFTILVAGIIAATVVGSLSAQGKLSGDGPKQISPPNLNVMPNSGVCAIDLNDGSSRVNFFYQNGDGGLEEWLFDGKDWARYAFGPWV